MANDLPNQDKCARRILQRFNKALNDYRLIDDGDRILAGISGGKDSMALLELLAQRSRVFKPRFSVIAAHVGMTNIGYESDTAYLQDFCERLGVTFVHRDTSFDASTDTRKSPCFLCSWNRRKALFTLAKEYDCNKIALGHHMDDILETLLMNLTFQGSFSTMPVSLRMRKFPLTIIRPLCLVHEADIEQLALTRQYRKQTHLCPYEHDSHRADMKQLLQRLEAMNPEARYNLWGALERSPQPKLVCNETDEGRGMIGERISITHQSLNH
ncbi:MAG: ATP-binding protein [Bacteroidales bacterium]|nr:ATP-binding protein [Bacteroidales bacterium]